MLIVFMPIICWLNNSLIYYKSSQFFAILQLHILNEQRL